ncbi:electron transfer flavoprotein subunit alpha/FixB family protein [Natrarchaeobius oligotrophus]|uniref:Electron transfer flavoprotein subunit alpha/FixB family protein n=1 Tax=Natrarchaeobius chitinivorans TaxID=1679083 RepID=A0A3N6PM21_NATCH|nr:electron transfer flavoprotein subunit alpha/FixB family protein [Natrarchaeobius chitinivorans]RQH02590.1 electron transfer flavoprotein subunit alpha/FixB family protein [Natrarchaeobius chitinivorans]
MSAVLVVADHRQGELRDVSYELVSAGDGLAEQSGGDLHLAVVGGDVDRFADELDLAGVDAIHTIARGEEFNHDVYVESTEQLVESIEPTYVLGPNSVNGLDYLPAVANRLGRPLVTDAIDLETDGDRLELTRECYGGKVETTIELEGEAVVSVREGEWPAATEPGDASIEPFDVTIDEDAVGSTVTGFEEVTGGDVDITEADVLVSIGRGIEDEENLDLVRDLADALEATLSSSRPIVDNGWLPPNRQVGQSGKVVTPDVYVAIGISGAVQHVAGMKGSDTIVAINTDPDAPIMDIADYAIHDDLFDVVPALIEQFE